jgi:hypothetical protein
MITGPPSKIYEIRDILLPQAGARQTRKMADIP